MNLSELQSEVQDWCDYNFGDERGLQISKDPLIGCMEELGELAHSVLKQSQGIRGTAEEHEAAGQDSVGDLVIYLASFCARRGWNIADCVGNAWDVVKQRNWKFSPITGEVPAIQDGCT